MKHSVMRSHHPWPSGRVLSLLSLSTLIVLPTPLARASQAYDSVATTSAETASYYLAQAVPQTILLFETPTYSVRVFQRNDRTFMNVHNRRTNVTEQSGAAADVDLNQTTEGNWVNYTSFGNRDGQAVAYTARVSRNRDTQLRIVGLNGEELVEEDGQSVRQFDIAEIPFGQERLGESNRNNVLAFETETYATRVFRREDKYFMNLYIRETGQTRLNGAPAELAQPRGPNDDRISYVSGGSSDGRPVKYFVHLQPNGRGIVEMVDLNGEVIFREANITRVTENIPAEDAPYVVAVFGDDDTLTRVKTFYPEASFERSDLGTFINVGDFRNRDSAMARVFDLRGQGFESRLLYRRVNYR
ncbi:uncharacterized protein XM38_002660 [Halomicronema hongdechloris C2206]|uniref:Uncharacterized protein n=1 Tax=Halomicronema hongdechloris C2206 TaxID=1641165 RepID=A0A1Z3HGA0_9CYAN|nr:hypothetical protein [Halomicronema hongdechloris]ASC69339.1 uncharacterized protein XM38_002660 [Halomicronema hongdechloris C2206]